MASDIEVQVEEQVRGREEQPPQPRPQGKRGKSKAPPTGALESRVASIEQAVSSMDNTIEGISERLDGLETDYGEITQVAKSNILEFSKARRAS